MKAALVFAAVVCSAAIGQARPLTQVHYVMGTYLRVTADGPAAAAGMTRCFADTRRLESVFSRYDAASELRRVNAAAGTPTIVSADFARLFTRAETLRRRTGGAFDVRVGGLTASQVGLPDATAPGSDAARDPHQRHATLTGRTLTLAPSTQLDFDGIAKGYAVDRCVGLLRAAGVRRALVDLGQSSLAAIGAPLRARHWQMAVRGPDDATVVGTLRLRDVAVSVSAARRGGRAHIVDPRRGVAVESDAVGIVLAANATDAEAYTKALVIWGGAGARRVEALGAVAAIRLATAVAEPGPRARQARVFTAWRTPRPLDAAEGALL